MKSATITTKYNEVPWGTLSPNPGVYPLEDTGEVEKQRISSAAFLRISCSCVGSLSSVALFCYIFSFGTFFGFIRVYTVLFSDPNVGLTRFLWKPHEQFHGKAGITPQAEILLFSNN